MWFNPILHVLCPAVRLQEVVRENVSAFRFKCGHVADEHDAIIEKTIRGGQPIPIETEETAPQSRLKPKMSRDSLPATH
jgi:hypothetical protein